MANTAQLEQLDQPIIDQQFGTLVTPKVTPALGEIGLQLPTAEPICWKSKLDVSFEPKSALDDQISNDSWSAPVGMLGCGDFGMALIHTMAQRPSNQIPEVLVRVRTEEEARSINKDHRNLKHFSEIELPKQVRATTDMDAVLSQGGMVLVATSSSALPDIAKQSDNFGALPQGSILVSLAKGFVSAPPGSGHPEFRTPSQFLEHVNPNLNVSVLSGPGIAKDVIQSNRTSWKLVSASKDDNNAAAQKVRFLLDYGALRVYISNDPLGVEIAGAMKNALSLFMGLAAGTGCSREELGVFFSAAFWELLELGHAWHDINIKDASNAFSTRTLRGIVGHADLALSAVGGRNRRFGEEFVKEQLPMDQILSKKTGTFEGVNASRAALWIAKQSGRDLPIISSLNRILFDGVNPNTEIEALMNRVIEAKFKGYDEGKALNRWERIEKMLPIYHAVEGIAREINLLPDERAWLFNRTLREIRLMAKSMKGGSFRSPEVSNALAKLYSRYSANDTHKDGPLTQLGRAIARGLPVHTMPNHKEAYAELQSAIESITHVRDQRNINMPLASYIRACLKQYSVPVERRMHPKDLIRDVLTKPVGHDEHDRKQFVV